MCLQCLKPDVVFVVPDAVWRDYDALRARCDPMTLRFHHACEREVRAAVRRRDLMAALHWRAFDRLALEYGRSPVSALEVGGVRFRETEKQSFLRYPDDADLRPVPIGVAPAACHA
ncbi:hypothetical protein H9Q09_07885 [Aurantimonas sp. DM33-3]|uniref:hypothetical protein n=1 Tax=Aurantimonas sp. DM33-3 TaxID=2766955 RepID=UPI00165270F4|nr:hypothetical protein [Aurantimonas sp. DM33-3]MBC6716117.1 hypothetical protein [Aurantimonas sp. DM33-3]